MTCQTPKGFPWFRLLTEFRMRILELCLCRTGVIKPQTNGVALKGPFEPYLLVSHAFRTEAMEAAFGGNVFCFSGLSHFNDFLAIIGRQSEPQNAWHHIRKIQFEICLMNDTCCFHPSHGNEYDVKRWFNSVRDVQYLLRPIYHLNQTSGFLNSPYEHVNACLAKKQVQVITVYTEAFYGFLADGTKTFFHIDPVTHATIPTCVRKIPGRDMNSSDPEVDDLSHWDADEGISFHFYLRPSRVQTCFDQAEIDFINWLYPDLASGTGSSAELVLEAIHRRELWDQKH